jgi:hypothetical protein
MLWLIFLLPSSTLMVFPFKILPFISLIAVWASSLTAIPTNPIPFDSPVALFLNSLTDTTWPKASKALRKSSSVVSGDRFPTYIFIYISLLLILKEILAVQTTWLNG